MKKRVWVIGGAALLVAAGVLAATRGTWNLQGAVAQAPQAPRTVPVEVAKAVRKAMPVRIEALGTVTPISSVAIKSRVETEIAAVHFQDGAHVKEGDQLFTLDCRFIKAQIKQAEGNIARDKAQLDGAERDVRRYTDLVAKNATPIVNLDNAKTQADTFRANTAADQGALENLKVLLSFCTIQASITGRIGVAGVKIGNLVRPADTAPLATINQISPIYVTFSVPQRNLADVRQAIAAESATVEAIVPGESKRPSGQVTMIENAVDPATGMMTIRATMPNADEILWPGQLVTSQLTLRVEEAVAVPSQAVQVSQTGTYVFVVKDGVATVRPVTVARVVDRETVISKGLDGDETVVTDGQLQLSNGTRVAPRDSKAAGT